MLKNKYHLFCFLFILFLSMQSTLAFGTLDTAKVGIQVNLSESNNATFIIKTSNPTGGELIVTLIPLNFTNIKNNNSFSFSLNSMEYKLKSGESEETLISIPNIKAGKYEGKIKVVFEKEGIKQKTSLNSVIHINAFGKKEENLMWAFIPAVIILLVIGIVILISKTKKFNQLKGGY